MSLFPGSLFNKKSAYDDSKTRAEETRVRDEIAYSYKSTESRKKRTPYKIVPIGTAGAFIAYIFLIQLLGRALILVIGGARSLLSGNSLNLKPMTFWSLLFCQHMNVFGFLLLIIGTAITYLIFDRLYKAQYSIEDANKDLLEGDVNSASIESPYVLLEKYDYMFDTKVWRRGYNAKGDIVDLSITSILTHMPIADSMTVRGRDGRVRFDKKFMESLFDIAGVHPKAREYYDSKRLRYNPKGLVFGKTVGDTLADSINKTAFVPDCEDAYSDEPTQDPGGIYIVSTDPENTIVVTETRGGKGQKYIEALLDIFSRTDPHPNIVVTDLKMELLRMCLRTFTRRGYNVKSLNLLVPTKTDAINFIGYALESAIRGDIDAMENTITNIADIYFPKEAGGNDPMWQNAASAVFKRTVMGLIDYICEEVNEMKYNSKLTPGQIRQMSDELYGKVTLFNAYRFIVTTSAKEYTDPSFINISDNGGENGEQVDSKSGMTLFFDATDALYQNRIRAKIANNDKPIRTVAPSERMLASIYGIALFGMIFFTDDRVIKLTSARPSENLDMAGFAFPRRLAVRFDKTFATKKSILNDVVRWSCYEDPEMTKPFLTENGKIDKDFIYDVGTIDVYGWADTVFKGIFPNKLTYIKLEIFSQDNNLKSYEFNFVFKKDYRKSYSGQQILNNPITGEPEVRGGTLSEYQLVPVEKRDVKTGKLLRDEYGKPVTENKVKLITTHNTVFKKSLILSDDPNRTVEHKQPVITNYDIHYSEKPSALFLVAPLQSYNKILLITIDMLCNMQTTKSYITNSNQKPFYETKYVLDEFGNTRAEGKGIPDLDIKMTSALGQGQQFTLILQSLKQIESLYGAEKAETIKGSVSKYLVMKIKDEDTINTLMGMNGDKYTVQKTSQTNDKPIDMFFNNLRTKQSVSETRSRDITNVLSKNDFLRLNGDAKEGRAIIISGNNNPIVSAGSTILPMSFALHANRMGGRGDDISVQNPPTMSSTLEFDALRNIPDFESWLKVRVAQAKLTPKVLERYKEVYGYTDLDLQRLDADLVAAEIMHGVNQNLAIERANRKLSEETDASIIKNGGKVFDHTNYEIDHINDHKRDMSYANADERQTVTEKSQLQLEKTHNTIEKALDPDANDDLSMRIKETVMERTTMTKTSEATAQVITDVEIGSKVNRQLSDAEAFNGKFDTDYANDYVKKRYVFGTMSRADIISPNTECISDSFASIVAAIYDDLTPYFKREQGFKVVSGTHGADNLYAVGGEFDGELLIADNGGHKYTVMTTFGKVMIQFDSWTHVCGGRFEQAIKQYLVTEEQWFDGNL